MEKDTKTEDLPAGKVGLFAEKKEVQNSDKSENNSPEIAQNKYLWIAGALILVAVIWFGFKMVIGGGVDYTVTLIDSPKEVPAGGVATFTWRVDGSPVTINHTTVYLGTASNPGTLGKDVKPADTVYTDFVKDFADGKYDIPLQFIGNIKMTTAGKYYFRVYALVGDKHYWTDEYTLNVK